MGEILNEEYVCVHMCLFVWCGKMVKGGEGLMNVGQISTPDYAPIYPLLAESILFLE